MNDWLCPGCMRTVGEKEEICPYCGQIRDERREPDSRRFWYSNVNPERLLPIGTVLKNRRYLVGEPKGCGAYSVVYIGLDLTLQKRVAIKELLPGRKKDCLNQNASEIERAENEALIMAKADGLPGFARVYDMFHENNTVYIVENYIEGRTLAEIRMDLHGQDAYELENWLPLVRPVMCSLEQLHRTGIIHGDVSSNNIMLDRHGNAWIVDFGRAVEMGKKPRASDVETGGRGALVAPEIAKLGIGRTAQIGPWTDVYCVCAMLYQMVNFCGAASLQAGGLPDLQDIPEKYCPVFARGLAEEPRDRIQNMAELSKAFQLAQDSAKQPSETEPQWPAASDDSGPQPLRRLTFCYGQMFNSDSGGCLIIESGCVIGTISDWFFSFLSYGRLHIACGGFYLSSSFADGGKIKDEFPYNREEYLRRDYVITAGNYEQNIIIEAAKLLHTEDGYRICFHDAEIAAKRGEKTWTFYAAETMAARIMGAPDGINLLLYRPLTELQTLVLSFFTWIIGYME